MAEQGRRSGENEDRWPPRAAGRDVGADLFTPRGGARPAVVDDAADETRRVTFVEENELSKNFVRAFARARALAEGAPSRGHDSSAPSNVGLSDEWRRLGRDLGFAPIVDDLALFISGQPGFVSGDDLAARVEKLAGALASHGREHAAIAVVASGLTHAEEDRLFAAGAHVVEVEHNFFDLADDERLALLRSKLRDDDGMQPVPAAAEDPAADPDIYDAVNPDLSEDEIESWVKRLGST